MSAPQRVFELLDPEAIAGDTLEFIRVKSETGAEADGSRFLAELLRREGFEVTLDEAAPGRPNVYARLEGTGNGRSLLFNGHTDTIPIGRSTSPARDGDWVVGRGAEDMKGGLVAMVHAVSAIRRAGIRMPGDVWLTGVVGHETPIGKKEGPRRLIQRLNAGDIRADAILIVEGPSAIWSASLGSAVFTVSISSSRGAIHTLHVPYRENPAYCLGLLLTRFEEWEQAFETAPAHPLCGRPRINVGTVHGGDYMNRLPTPLTVTGQRRWLPGQTCELVLRELQQLCSELGGRTGLTLEVELEGTREPFETPADHPLVQALEHAGAELTGAPPDRIGMALVGDANLYANEGGVPTLYYGPAYKTAHSDDERVLVERLHHCAGMYALAALHFCR
jgi:succinyl-diaminopimelate desuccinylase